MNCHLATGDVIAKAVPFDRNVFRSGAVLGVLVCDLQGASIIFVDNGLVLFAEQWCRLIRTGFSEGWVCCCRAKF